MQELHRHAGPIRLSGVRRPKVWLSGVTVLLASAVLLTGCASEGSTVPPVSSSTAAEASPAATAEAAVASLGDVVGKTENGEPVLITDERGSYQKVVLAPDSPLATTANDNVFLSSVAELGFTDADVLAAQRFIAEFIASEGIDSTALESGEAGYRDWATTTGQNYMLPQWRAELIAAPEPSLVNNTVKATINIPFVRDGGPRLTEAAISFKNVSAENLEDGEVLVFAGDYEASYRATNDAVLSAYEAAGYSREDTVQTLPHLEDPEGETTVKGTMDFRLGVVKSSSSWLISGYANTFDNRVEGAVAP